MTHIQLTLQKFSNGTWAYSSNKSHAITNFLGKTLSTPLRLTELIKGSKSASKIHTLWLDGVDGAELADLQKNYPICYLQFATDGTRNILSAEQYNQLPADNQPQPSIQPQAS